MGKAAINFRFFPPDAEGIVFPPLDLWQNLKKVVLLKDIPL
jgi:hypothetical protein